MTARAADAGAFASSAATGASGRAGDFSAPSAVRPPTPHSDGHARHPSPVPGLSLPRGRSQDPGQGAAPAKCRWRDEVWCTLSTVSYSCQKKKKKVFNLNLNVREAIRHIRNVVHSIIKLAQRLKNSISQGKKRRGREPGLDLDIKTQCDMVTVTGSHFLFFGPVREDL